MRIRNLSFKWQKSGILDLEFGIYGVESRIRERLNSWIPLYGANRTTIVVKLNLIGWQCDRGFIKSDHRNFAFVRIDHIERLINSYRLHQNTVKFRKYAPGLIFFKGPFWEAYFWRGLSTEGNLRFKIDRASLIVGSNLPFLLCFTLYLRAISKYKPPGGLIFGGAI